MVLGATATAGGLSDPFRVGASPQRILQVANGSRSGGVWTYLEETGRQYGAQGIERVLIFPGPAFRVDRLDRFDVRITLPARSLPRSGGYRMLLDTALVRSVVKSAASGARTHLELSDKSGLFGLGRYAQQLGMPTVLFSHERIGEVMSARFPRVVPVHRLADAWSRHNLPGIDRVVCASNHAAEEFLRLGYTNVARVPIGVDLDVFHPQVRRSQPDAQAGAELLYVGRCVRDKRVDLFVDAIRILTRAGISVRGTVIGDGPERGALATRARGIPVTFLGQRARPEVALHMANADLVVGTSPVETFGLAVVEALASGTPVVVNRAGALPELLVGAPEGAGRVAGGSAADFAQQIREQLLVPPKIARPAARRQAEHYPWSATAVGLLAVHHEAAQRHRRLNYVSFSRGSAR
ncbi:MAG: glycosyltransferase [Acidimicrobiia bacterium]